MILPILFFIFFPFFAFVYSLSDIRKPALAFIFIAFYALFGYCNHFELISADIARIGYKFQTAYNASNAFDLYNEGDRPDLYSSLLFYYLSPFTSNPKILCAFIGLIYGVLSYAVFVNVYKFWPTTRSFGFYLYVLIVISNISLVHMTGVRFYTGGLLFLLSAINFIKGKRLWAIGALIPCFIHFSLIVASGAFVVYVFLGKIFKIKNLSIPLLIIAFVVSFINLGQFAQGYIDMLDIDNEALEVKINAYTSPETSAIQHEQTAYRAANILFTTIFNIISKIGLTLSLLILIYKTNFKTLSAFTRNLFLFTIILSITALFSMALTDTAMRFVNLAWCSLFVLFPLLINRLQLNAKQWIYSFAFFNFYSIAYLFFNAPRMVTPDLWYAPLPLLIYEGLNFRITWFVI
ncbi:MAG: EpsG family protein [Muribaculaceae bacterium]|nr:EpsG family protein [Muribaculaceae bacterium]